MRKIYLICCFTILFLFSTHTEEIFNSKEIYRGAAIIDDLKSVYFSDGSYIHFVSEGTSNDYGIWNKSFKFELEGENGLYRLKLDSGLELYGLISEQYLVLYNEELNEPIFLGGRKINSETVYFFTDIQASSFLIENTKKYDAQNLRNLNVDSPWVEGVDGYGIGEKLLFYTNNPHLIIFSGFVSVRNPKLYSQNSRIKKIKVKRVSSNKEIIIDIKDTAGGQQIDLEDLIKYPENDLIEIEILDVYKGTKYEDTCINSILIGYSRY